MKGTDLKMIFVPIGSRLDTAGGLGAALRCHREALECGPGNIQIWSTFVSLLVESKGKKRKWEWEKTKKTLMYDFIFENSETSEIT